MRILIISRRLNFKQSAPKCNANLAISLSKMGYEVHVLTSSISDMVKMALLNSKISLHFANEKFATKYISPISYTWIANKLKDKYNIDYTIGNGYTFFDEITWVHFPKLAWIRKLRELNLGVPHNLKIEAYGEKFIFKSSTTLWAPSKKGAIALINYYSIPDMKVFYLHNGVDVDFYTPLPIEKKEEKKKRFNLQEKSVAIFVGENPQIKGLYLLLKEISKVKNINEFYLYIAGIKPNDILISLIHKLDLIRHVKVLGPLQPQELKKFYQLSDFFILPSLYDTFPLSTLEAMASGAIPIVSTFSGSSEIILNEKNGFLINPFYPGNIAKILDYLLLASKNKLHFLRQNAIITAKKYSWNHIAKELIKKMLKLNENK